MGPPRNASWGIGAPAKYSQKFPRPYALRLDKGPPTTHWYSVMKLPLGLCVVAMLVCTVTGVSAESRTLPLWPGKVPDDSVVLPAETDLSKPNDQLIAGRPVIRLGNISTPT